MKRTQITHSIVAVSGDLDTTSPASPRALPHSYPTRLPSILPWTLVIQIIYLTVPLTTLTQSSSVSFGSIFVLPLPAHPFVFHCLRVRFTVRTEQRCINPNRRAAVRIIIWSSLTFSLISSLPEILWKEGVARCRIDSEAIDLFNH